MIASILHGTDAAVLIGCAVVGALALGFFAAIIAADARDARQRAAAKAAFERARKHFSRS